MDRVEQRLGGDRGERRGGVGRVRRQRTGTTSAGIEGIGANISIASSEASGNASDGIVVSGSAGVLKRNRADGNGFDGQASDLIGLGIYV